MCNTIPAKFRVCFQKIKQAAARAEGLNGFRSCSRADQRIALFCSPLDLSCKDILPGLANFYARSQLKSYKNLPTGFAMSSLCVSNSRTEFNDTGICGVLKICERMRSVGYDGVTTRSLRVSVEVKSC